MFQGGAEVECGNAEPFGFDPASIDALLLVARRIVDDATSVRIFNESILARAQVWTINGFSAHADQPSLLAWLGDTARRKAFLVHGEYDRGMHALQEVLKQRGVACQLPGLHESIKLDCAATHKMLQQGSGASADVNAAR